MTVLRAPFLWASTNFFLAERLPRYRFVRRAVRRFMPGEEPQDALAEARRLNQSGAGAILTLLGENVALSDEAEAVVGHYRGVLEEVRRERLDVEISVKATHLGMDLGLPVARTNLLALLSEGDRDGGPAGVRHPRCGRDRARCSRRGSARPRQRPVGSRDAARGPIPDTPRWGCRARSRRGGA